MTCGSEACANSAAASSSRGIRTRSVGPVRARSSTGGNTTAMLALLYDVHGNVLALDAVLADAGGRAPTPTSSAATWRCSGPGRRQSVARLRELSPATWIRGNGERWTADPGAAPEPVRPATAAAREALGDRARRPARRAARRAPRSATAPAPGTARRSATCARSRPSPPTTRPSCSHGVGERRLVFGHTHLPFARMSAVGGIELVNPGSVGMPFDGDHRAAYALRTTTAGSSIAASPTTTPRYPPPCASATATPAGSRRRCTASPTRASRRDSRERARARRSRSRASCCTARARCA